MISFVVKPIFRTIAKILSFILFAVTVFAAYGGRFDPEYFAIPGVAVMLLPFLTIFCLIVIILWFITGHWITAGIGVLALFAASGPILNTTPVKFSRNPTAGAVEFSVLSWNFLHGIDQTSQTAKQEGNASLDFIINTDADIVCLQEMNQWHPSEVPNLNADFNLRLHKAYPYMAFQNGTDNRVFSKYKIENINAGEFMRKYLPTDDPDYGYTPSKYSIYKVNIRGNIILLINTHLISPGLSPEERNVVTDMKSVDKIEKNTKELKNTILGKIRKSLINHKRELSILTRALANYKGPIIMCGDFNDVPESYAWRIMKKAGFEDAYTEVGFGPLITYNQHLFLLHLDQMLYRGDLRPLKFKKFSIKTSDHYPIMTTFEIMQ